MSGTIYIVATPIGNLDDITLRALKVLKEVSLVLCEDTRVTRKLLDHFDIKVDTLSYHQQSNLNRKQEILNMLIQGKNIALVTDAGTPGISDPGNELIDFLLTQDQELKTIPIPGPSSITSALSVSGMRTGTFVFIGFWPKKKTKKLLKMLDCLPAQAGPVVFFDSPFRILKTIDLLIKEFGENKRIYLGQELTKLHERSLRGSISEVKQKLLEEQKELGRVKGELVCILEF